LQARDTAPDPGGAGGPGSNTLALRFVAKVIDEIEEGASFAGRYRVVRLLASGAMGAVHEVIHLETERRRALKVLHPHVLEAPGMRARFALEARIAARVES